MKINGIFELVPESLYSVQFDGEVCHEFTRVFRLWRDADYLQLFFQEHYEDLLAFWEYMPVEEAIRITRAEALRLDKKLLAVARSGRSEEGVNLSMIFRPLHRGAWRLDDFEKSKARGLDRKSWLRVYAVRIKVNHFVVTGGAIKLTRTMNNCKHLTEELDKLEAVCRFLREDQKDEFGLFELI